jgi:hypothetical protein
LGVEGDEGFGGEEVVFGVEAGAGRGSRVRRPGTGARFPVTGGRGGGRERVFDGDVFMAHDGEVDDGLGAGLAGLVEPALFGEVEAEEAGGDADAVEHDARVAAVERAVDEGVEGGGGGDLEGGEVFEQGDAALAVVDDEGWVAVVAVVVAVEVARGDEAAAADAVHFQVAALVVVEGWFGHGCSCRREFGVSSLEFGNPGKKEGFAWWGEPF